MEVRLARPTDFPNASASRGPFAHARRETCTISLAPSRAPSLAPYRAPPFAHARREGWTICSSVTSSHLLLCCGEVLACSQRSEGCMLNGRLLRVQLAWYGRAQRPARRAAAGPWYGRAQEGRLGVLRQVSGELDAVDDAVGCGNGHHLDVLGGLDGILALAHLMLGEPSGRQSLEITSCWGNHRGGNQ